MPRVSSHSRRTVILAACFLAAVLAAAGALALRLSGNEGVVLTGQTEHIEAVAGTWQRVNPLYATTNEVDQDLSQLVFSGLVRIAPDGRVLPDLADAPQVSEDGRTYTFKLRKGISWHDGQPVTSRDVVFTVNQLVSPDFKGDPAVAAGWLGVDIQASDAATVVIQLKQASAPFLARNATIGILPEHLLASLDAKALYEAPFNANPIGTGPYRLERLDSREARLVANDSYYLGAPGITRVTLKFYSDYSSALRALQSGDASSLLVRDTLSSGQQGDLERVKGTKVEQFQRSTQVLLYLNNDQALFQDERVRTALSIALDRKAIAAKAFAGAAVASSSPIAPGSWAYDKTRDLIAPDTTTALKMLDDAGWKRHPTTGILTKDGAEFRFTIRTDNDPVRVEVANEIARELAPLGIRATVASTTFSVLRRDFLEVRKYEAAVAAWDQGPDPDPYFGWHSSQLGSAGLNLANFQDAVVDELIAKGRTSNTLEVRADAYRQFQEVWQDLTPSVVLAYPTYIYARADSLENLAPGILFTGSQRFADVYRWRE